jgi:preprotein translocase subunit Sec63
MKKKTTIRFLRDVDDIMHVLTGKRIKDVTARAIETFGEDIINNILREPTSHLSPDDPYSILEVRPDASDIVVKAVHRAKARIYHPDNKETGNEEMFKRIQGAYDAIAAQRGKAEHPRSS